MQLLLSPFSAGPELQLLFVQLGSLYLPAPGMLKSSLEVFPLSPTDLLMDDVPMVERRVFKLLWKGHFVLLIQASIYLLVESANIAWGHQAVDR